MFRFRGIPLIKLEYRDVIDQLTAVNRIDKTIRRRFLIPAINLLFQILKTEGNMRMLIASLALLISGLSDIACGASWSTTGRSEYWVDEYGYSYTNQCSPPYSGTGQPPCPTDVARGWVQNSDAALGNIYQQIGGCNVRQNGECGGFAYAIGGVASQGQVAGSCTVVGAYAVNVNYRRYMYYLGSCNPSLPPDPATCPNDAVEGASYQAIELQCR